MDNMERSEHLPEEHIPDGQMMRANSDSSCAGSGSVSILKTGAQWHMLPQKLSRTTKL